MSACTLVTRMHTATSMSDLVALAYPRVATQLCGEQAPTSLFPFAVRDQRPAVNDGIALSQGQSASGQPAGRSAGRLERATRSILPITWQLGRGKRRVGK